MCAVFLFNRQRHFKTHFFLKYDLARKKQLDESISKGTAAEMLKNMNLISDDDNVQVTLCTI